MSTASQVVTNAYRELGAIDIWTNESTALSAYGLDTLSRMMMSWAAHGINLDAAGPAGGTAVGDVTIDSNIVVNMPITAGILVGMGVSGTGIQDGTTVTQVNSPTAGGMSLTLPLTSDTGTIVLSSLATATNSGVTLTFTEIPLDEKFEDGIIALLAIRLAPALGITPSDELKAVAKAGWDALQAAYITAPNAQFDQGITRMSSQRFPSSF